MKNIRKAMVLPFAASLALTGIGIASATPQPILSATSAPGTYTEQNIGAKLIGDSTTHRIPALADLGNGVVIAAWDGRPYNADDAPNPNSIVLRRSTDNGATWSDTSYIAKGNLGTDGTQKYGYSDPSFVVDHETGKVFAFFVYSKNQGFWGSQYGSDIKNNPNIMGSVVVESSDQGKTWSTPRDITSIVKPGTGLGTPQPGDIRATFATSGQGIQLKYGQYKGRLMQQFAGMVKMPDGSEKTRAYTVYSDDHGVTWKRGDFAGIDMDENKVVELSDGRVMLNTRDYKGAGYRKVLISNNGGETWGEMVTDTELPDPRNNASIIRMFPDAPEGSADAKKLIFTNSNHNANYDRINLSARVSCDDGETWPSVRQIKDGFAAYSTATALSNGKFGVLYEASYKTDMRFGTFDEEWLNYVCAPLSVESVTTEPGTETTVPVTITNQENTPISGTLTINDVNGYTAPDIEVAPLAPGETRTIDVTLKTASTVRSGTLDAVFTSSTGTESRGTFKVTVPSAYTFGVNISPQEQAERDLKTNPYKVGEKITYTFTVTNTSSEAVNVVPSAGNFEVGFLPSSAPNCRYLNLAAEASYTCKTASHTVTQEDLNRGYFTPTMSFKVTSRTDATRTKTVEHTGTAIQLVAAEPEITIAGEIIQPKASYAVGDVVKYRFNIKNTQAHRIAVTPTAGNFEKGFFTNSRPNCRYRNLGAYSSYECVTAQHTITAEDLARGYFELSATFEVTPQTEGKTPTFTHTGQRITVSKVASNK